MHILIDVPDEAAEQIREVQVTSGLSVSEFWVEGALFYSDRLALTDSKSSEASVKPGRHRA